jgi:hypothetical protein
MLEGEGDMFQNKKKFQKSTRMSKPRVLAFKHYNPRMTLFQIYEATIPMHKGDTLGNLILITGLAHRG